MTDLIQRLNKLATLTPDQIVDKLTTRGWRKPSELGEEYFEEHRYTPHVHLMCQRGQIMGTPGLDWTFRACVGERGSYQSFVERLETGIYAIEAERFYWIIPQSEFMEGNRSPCIT